MLQSLFYLTISLHVSGVTIIHLREHKTTVTTASGNRYTVLLSAAIVEELELIWVCCGWCTPPTTHSNQFQLFHDSNRQQYGVMVTRCCSYSCFVLLKMGDNDTRNTQSNHQIKINSVTCASCWDFYIRILLRYTDPCILNIWRLLSVVGWWPFGSCNIRKFGVNWTPLNCLVK